MSNIKQAPFLGLIGLGGGGTGLTVGGSADKKIWVDDFFGIQLRKSTGAVANVNNGMDLSGDGGLVWTKSRSNAFWHVSSTPIHFIFKAAIPTSSSPGSISSRISNALANSFFCIRQFIFNNFIRGRTSMLM